MPTFDVDKKEITAFEFKGIYLFKEYFEQTELFGKLEKYYNPEKYRFEIPEDKLIEVRQILDSFYYEITIADNPEAYCVVATDDTEIRELLQNTVLRTRTDGQEVFLMKDKLSARQAVERGARQLENQEITLRQPTWRIGRS